MLWSWSCISSQQLKPYLKHKTIVIWNVSGFSYSSEDTVLREFRSSSESEAAGCHKNFGESQHCFCELEAANKRNITLVAVWEWMGHWLGESAQAERQSAQLQSAACVAVSDCPLCRRVIQRTLKRHRYQSSIPH